MNNDFYDLLKRLTDADVEFIIVGGFAGVAHGCTYVTQDMDICCDFSTDNLLKLHEALCDLHPVHRMTPKRRKFELKKEAGQNFKKLYLDTDAGQLDCLSFIDGVGDYKNVKQASDIIESEGVKLAVINIDALIKAKKAMDRPHDREAIFQLEAIKKLKKP
ncbi:nucleotidyltransferase [Planctomycetota bacterium]